MIHKIIPKGRNLELEPLFLEPQVYYILFRTNGGTYSWRLRTLRESHDFPFVIIT
jgi:hypothetical protein